MPRGLSLETRKIIDAAHEIASERQPITVRGICYVLFEQYGLISDMSKKSTNKVGTALRNARERGVIPWDWIVDGSRSGVVYNRGGWDSTAAYAQSVTQLNLYRRDYWDMQPVKLELWSEKGTVSGVIDPVLGRWGVDFKNFRGFNSASNVYGEAVRSQNYDKPMIALYIGDYDPSGLYMSEVDIPGRLRRYGGDVTIERIALTASDTEGRPGNDVAEKAGDGRFKWWKENGHGDRFWELDAMDPRALRTRVENAIASYIDPEAWARSASTERAEIQSLDLFYEKIERVRRDHFDGP